MPDPLDSRQLRAFATLSHMGSFTDAARELGLTQSAISHSMKALEGDVGCRLLDRLGKKVTLTQAGEQFLAHAMKILREMESAREGLQELGRWGHGRLRLGASLTVCQYILPAVLREFVQSFPHCVINIEAGDSAVAAEHLRQQRIDLAIALESPIDTQFDFEPLFTDELKFFVSPLHPWAKAGRVERKEIPRQNYILYSRASRMFELVGGYFRDERVTLPTSIELGNVEAIKELVKLNLGITILAPWVAREELSRGTLVELPLGKRKLKRQWGLLGWKSRRRSLPEETFAGLCHSVAREL